MNAKRFTYNYSSIQIHAQQTNCNYLAKNKIKKRKKKKTKKTEIVRKYFPLTPSPTPTHTRERERERERRKWQRSLNTKETRKTINTAATSKETRTNISNHENCDILEKLAEI